MKFAYLTKSADDLRVIDLYTSATQTVQLQDGRYGFSDGLGGVWATVEVQIPGYDFVYGSVEASAEHTNAHDALASQGPFPRGSEIFFRNRIDYILQESIQQ